MKSRLSKRHLPLLLASAVSELTKVACDASWQSIELVNTASFWKYKNSSSYNQSHSSWRVGRNRNTIRTSPKITQDRFGGNRSLLQSAPVERSKVLCSALTKSPSKVVRLPHINNIKLSELLKVAAQQTKQWNDHTSIIGTYIHIL